MPTELIPSAKPTTFSASYPVPGHKPDRQREVRAFCWCSILKRMVITPAERCGLIRRLPLWRLKRAGMLPGIYGSEYYLRQALNSPRVSAAQKKTLTNCWLWIANYHKEPRATAPWNYWALWQYCGDGKCGLPRSAYPISVANIRKAELKYFPRQPNRTCRISGSNAPGSPREESLAANRNERSRPSCKTRVGFHRVRFDI